MKRGSTRKLFFLARRRLGVTLSLMVAALIVAPHAQAKSPTGDATEIGRYVVQLQDPPLAAYDGTELFDAGPRGPLRMAATAPEITGEKRLNVRSPASMAYLAYLEDRRPDWETIFASRRDRVFALVVADLPAEVDREKVDVDFERFAARFSRTCRSRK